MTYLHDRLNDPIWSLVIGHGRDTPLFCEAEWWKGGVAVLENASGHTQVPNRRLAQHPALFVAFAIIECEIIECDLVAACCQ